MIVLIARFAIHVRSVGPLDGRRLRSESYRLDACSVGLRSSEIDGHFEDVRFTTWLSADSIDRKKYEVVDSQQKPQANSTACPVCRYRDMCGLNLRQQRCNTEHFPHPRSRENRLIFFVLKQGDQNNQAITSRIRRSRNIPTVSLTLQDASRGILGESAATKSTRIHKECRHCCLRASWCFSWRSFLRHLEAARQHQPWVSTRRA